MKETQYLKSDFLSRLHYFSPIVELGSNKMKQSDKHRILLPLLVPLALATSKEEGSENDVQDTINHYQVHENTEEDPEYKHDLPKWYTGDHDFSHYSQYHPLGFLAQYATYTPSKHYPTYKSNHDIDHNDLSSNHDHDLDHSSEHVSAESPISFLDTVPSGEYNNYHPPVEHSLDSIPHHYIPPHFHVPDKSHYEVHEDIDEGNNPYAPHIPDDAHHDHTDHHIPDTGSHHIPSSEHHIDSGEHHIPDTSHHIHADSGEHHVHDTGSHVSDINHHIPSSGHHIDSGEHHIPDTSHRIDTNSGEHHIPDTGSHVSTITHHIPSSEHHIDSDHHIPDTESHHIPSSGHHIDSGEHHIPDTLHHIHANSGEHHIPSTGGHVSTLSHEIPSSGHHVDSGAENYLPPISRHIPPSISHHVPSSGHHVEEPHVPSSGYHIAHHDHEIDHHIPDAGKRYDSSGYHIPVSGHHSHSEHGDHAGDDNGLHETNDHSNSNIHSGSHIPSLHVSNALEEDSHEEGGKNDNNGEEGEETKNVNYKFGYGVNDPHTDDHKSQYEERNGDQVTGQYMLKEPNGQYRIVKYSAAPHTGFQAKVEYVNA